MITSSNYIGIPYKSHGRDETGLDCWGLVRLIYAQELGIDLPSWSAEYTDADNVPATSVTNPTTFATWCEVQEGQTYDVGVFCIAGRFHVGVCIGGVKMLHITNGSNVCIERVDSSQWAKRFKGWYRYAGCN